MAANTTVQYAPKPALGGVPVGFDLDGPIANNKFGSQTVITSVGKATPPPSFFSRILRKTRSRPALSHAQSQESTIRSVSTGASKSSMDIPVAPSYVISNNKIDKDIARKVEEHASKTSSIAESSFKSALAHQESEQEPQREEPLAPVELEAEVEVELAAEIEEWPRIVLELDATDNELKQEQGPSPLQAALPQSKGMLRSKFLGYTNPNSTSPASLEVVAASAENENGAASTKSGNTSRSAAAAMKDVPPTPPPHSPMFPVFRDPSPPPQPSNQKKQRHHHHQHHTSQPATSSKQQKYPRSKQKSGTRSNSHSRHQHKPSDFDVFMQKAVDEDRRYRAEVLHTFSQAEQAVRDKENRQQQERGRQKERLAKQPSTDKFQFSWQRSNNISKTNTNTNREDDAAAATKKREKQKQREAKIAQMKKQTVITGLRTGWYQEEDGGFSPRNPKQQPICIDEPELAQELIQLSQQRQHTRHRSVDITNPGPTPQPSSSGGFSGLLKRRGSSARRPATAETVAVANSGGGGGLKRSNSISKRIADYIKPPRPSLGERPT